MPGGRKDGSLKRRVHAGAEPSGEMSGHKVSKHLEVKSFKNTHARTTSERLHVMLRDRR